MIRREAEIVKYEARLAYTIIRYSGSSCFLPAGFRICQQLYQ